MPSDTQEPTATDNLPDDDVRQEVERAMSTYLRPAQEYLTTIHAATYLGVSRQYLEIARHRGEGPPFIKLSRQVRYRRADLDAWMESRRQVPEAV